MVSWTENKQTENNIKNNCTLSIQMNRTSLKLLAQQKKRKNAKQKNSDSKKWNSCTKMTTTFKQLESYRRFNLLSMSRITKKNMKLTQNVIFTFNLHSTFQFSTQHFYRSIWSVFKMFFFCWFVGLRWLITGLRRGTTMVAILWECIEDDFCCWFVRLRWLITGLRWGTAMVAMVQTSAAVKHCAAHLILGSSPTNTRRNMYK